MQNNDVVKSFKQKMLIEAQVQEANEQTVFDAMLNVLALLPIQAWLSFSWGKAIITSTNFVKDLKAAGTLEQKKSVIKKYFSTETLQYVLDPTNLFSYTQGVPGIKDAGNDTTTELKEAKPSAGLTKKQKSDVVKKAEKGEDIGKKGKGFEKVAAKAAKQYGSKEAGERVAAASMWKNVKRK